LSGKSFSTSIDYAIAIERQPLETLRGRASFVASREGGYVAIGVATLKVYAATLPVIEPVNVAAEAFIDVRLEREEKKPEPVQPPPPPLPVPPKPAVAGPDTTMPPPGSASAPACSFEYSAWGECIRASKTQTRSVTSRKPAGCVESAKPALEQGCTPPPTEEDKRNAYLNCLCRCSSGWAGHIGVWYDPEQKTVPECKSSGPCIGGIGAWGCSSRHYFVGPNDCAKGCWDSAFGKDSYDAAKADKMRKDENKKFKQPLKVKIAASKNPADFGDIVDLTATATEGSGGYHDWNWGGCAQDAKETPAKPPSASPTTMATPRRTRSPSSARRSR
jgi:hypothetical protein